MGGPARASAADRLGAFLRNARLMPIRGTTRLAGVIGWPVKHSRSPLLHNHWCAHYAIDGAYVPLAVRPDDLGTALKGLRAAGFAGVNLTIPHKEAALSLMDRLDRSAERAGAVNTVVFAADGETVGLCSDGTGFVANLDAHGVSPKGRVLVLGAGGAARAVVAALLDRGCEVTITNRTAARAIELREALDAHDTLLWDAWPEALGDFDLLVNTTSLGMEGHGNTVFDLGQASSGLSVADIVYVPRQTPLLAAAETRGLRGVNGLGMLAHQAVIGFEAWFGVRPDVDAATIALLDADL
jgi:shikimate dehydrogenase